MYSKLKKFILLFLCISYTICGFTQTDLKIKTYNVTIGGSDNYQELAIKALNLESAINTFSCECLAGKYSKYFRDTNGDDFLYLEEENVTSERFKYYKDYKGKKNKEDIFHIIACTRNTSLIGLDSFIPSKEDSIWVGPYQYKRISFKILKCARV